MVSFFIYTSEKNFFMDQKLLKALEDIGYGLEALVEALEKKDEAKSDTGKALQSGDFGKQLQSISTQLNSIKADTQEILKQQKTILGISKEKENEKRESKTKEVEDAGDEKKKSKLKDGIGTILLIAVAVLAIGMAFKLVGKIDFLSVIALGLAIYIVSEAFAKVAALNLSIKEAFNTSVVLVMIAVAITASSWIMKLITPIGITQLLTATFIAVTFAAMSKYLENIFIATAVFDKLNVKPLALVKTLVSISAAITASSWIMQMISPITVAQGMTAVLISFVFSLIGHNLHKIAISVALFKRTKVKAKDLLLVLVGVAAAITASSWILQLLVPLSFTQLVTAILISAMFLLISFNLEKIAMGVIAFKKTNIKATDLLLVLVGISAAITASSWILDFIVPITFDKFLTALGIALIFALMSYIMPELAAGIAIIAKVVGASKVFLIPLVMVAISLAIMLSSHILAETSPIPFVELLRILALSVILAVATTVLGLAAFILIKVFGFSTILKGSIAIVALAFAIKYASLAISEGKYDIYPSVEWTLLAGLSITGFGFISWILNKLGGPVSYIKGGISIIAISATIMASSLILNMGEYNKYPSLKWILGVGASITAFGIAAVVLGSQALNPFFYAGLGVTLLVIATIMASSHILNLGKYEKYPSLKWVFSVGAALAAFSIAASLLGFQALNPFFYAGLGVTGLVAGSIVMVSKILAKGDYQIPGFISWAASVALLYGTFAPIILILGTVGVAAAAMGAIFGDGANPFKQGRKMLKDIAYSIVDVSAILAKGKYVGGPNKEWAKGVAIAIGAFAPVYDMLVSSSVFKAFGVSGVGPKEFNEAIRTVVGGIIFAANEFATNTAAFENGPPEAWAKGVGKAIGAFAPVYSILANEKGFFGTGVSIKDFKRAIRTISYGIIESAGIFKKYKGRFEEGNYPSVEWGKGVGAALGAFTPIFKALSKDTGWFTSGDDVINNMVKGVVKMSEAIVRVAKIIGKNSKYFEKDINPNFMKNVGKNMIDLYEVIKKLSEGEKETGGVFERIVNSLGRTSDPITKLSNKMVTLARGYDALAKSLTGLGTAMQGLNVKNMQDLGKFTSGVIRGELSVKTPQRIMTKTKAEMSQVKKIDKEKEKNRAIEKKTQDTLKKDIKQIIKILKSIDKSVSSVDDYIASVNPELESGGSGASGLLGG